jgi:signal transduction histidine kinase
VLYFTVLLGLAGAMFLLSDPRSAVTLPWLLLLPPIGHSVIILPRPGVAVVSACSAAILTIFLYRFYGWRALPDGLTLFSLAVLFTLVFTQIAVNAERARDEVQRLAGALAEANQKLREYALQVEELAATRERNRLAREIHDSLGHYLTVVNVQLNAALAMLERDAKRAAEAIGNAQTLTQDGLKDIRRSVAALRASPLDGRTLDAALRQIVEESRTAGLPTDMSLIGALRPLPAPAELTLYRAGQEGLTNARKHARATQARLVLDFRARDAVCLSVTDDGQGAAPGVGGFGLLGLKERAQLLGGEARVRTAPGSGFTLEVEIPG